MDAPVSGGKTGAATRQLAVMVGGERAIYERLKPILEAFGDEVFYAGGVGAGSVCTLVPHRSGHGSRRATAEGLTLGGKAGVAADALWEGVRRGAVGRMSGLPEGLPRTVCRGRFEPASFALALARQGITLATERGREYDVPRPVASLAEQIALEAMNRGGADKASGITVLLQEEAAGVQVRAPDVDPEKAARFISTHPETERDR